MPFVYLYFDTDVRTIRYIGKVTADYGKALPYEYLGRRHREHKREKWYNDRRDELIMFWAEVCTPADADIVETVLISKNAKYGNLENKSKTKWGESSLDIAWLNWCTWYEDFGKANKRVERMDTENDQSKIKLFEVEVQGGRTGWSPAT